MPSINIIFVISHNPHLYFGNVCLGIYKIRIDVQLAVCATGLQLVLLQECHQLSITLGYLLPSCFVQDAGGLEIFCAFKMKDAIIVGRDGGNGQANLYYEWR